MAWTSFFGRLIGNGAGRRRRRGPGELSGGELWRKIIRAERRRGRRPRSGYQPSPMCEYDRRFENDLGDSGGDCHHKAEDVLNEARRLRRTRA